MNAPRRRGTCPSLSQSMVTGDGLLVRIMPSGRYARPRAAAGTAS